MTRLNTKVNDCRVCVGWHGLCLLKGQGAQNMKTDTGTRYCYDLQVWMIDGVILDCNHPESMKLDDCCNSHKLAGKRHSCLSDH